VVPAADHQVAAIRRLTGATADIGAVGASAAVRLDERLQHADQPAGRVALLDAAIDELDRVGDALDAVDLGSDQGLIGPLGAAHDDLESTITRARHKVDDGRQLLEPVRDMLQGPSRFLLLATNNSEMAGGSGLALSAGIMTFDGGDMVLGDVVPAGDLRLPASVEVPDELRRIYRPTGVGIDFRSATRSPNLPAMGPVVASMVEQLDPKALGVDSVDGVIVVDPLTLRSVLELTGPVEVRGRRIDASNVLPAVLHDNYTQFDSPEDRPDRVSYQGDIAKAVFDLVTERDVPAAELAQALLESSQGRHLMIWADDAPLQHVWQELGVDGSLVPNGLMISFQNYAANKLDWYLRPRASMDVQLLPSGDYRAHLTMTMAVPPLSDLTDASPYIIGPDPGQQGTFLTVHLPTAAYDITTTDPAGFDTKGVDGPSQVRTFLVEVPNGTTLERSLDFSLPRSTSALTLLPSARVEPLPLVVDGVTTLDDAKPRYVTWLAAIPPRAPDDGAPMPVRILVVMGSLLTLTGAAAVAWHVWRSRTRSASPRLLDVARLAAGVALLSFALAGIFGLMLSAPRV